MSELIEMGTVSSRGQIAIPSGIRSKLGLEDGSKILFFLEDDALLMKKVTPSSFAELTKPLREAKKRIGESHVNQLVHKMRKR